VVAVPIGADILVIMPALEINVIKKEIVWPVMALMFVMLM